MWTKPSLLKHSFVHPAIEGEIHYFGMQLVVLIHKLIMCLKHYIQAWSANRAITFATCSQHSNHHFKYFLVYVFVYIICDKIQGEDWTLTYTVKLHNTMSSFKGEDVVVITLLELTSSLRAISGCSKKVEEYTCIEIWQLHFTLGGDWNRK